MWVLMEEGQGGWSVVHEKNVLRAPAQEVQVGEEYTFFYRGSTYTGKALEVNECHDVVNDTLKELSRKKKKPLPSYRKDNDSELPSKRKITAPVFYGQSPGASNSNPIKKPPPAPPKMTEEEKQRKKLFELNKKEAEKRSKDKVLEKLQKAKDKENEKDPNYNPGSEDVNSDEIDEQDNEYYDDDVVIEVTANALARKKERLGLLKTCKSNECTSGTPSSTTMKSPTKEDLKRQLEVLQMKLQVAYESGNEGKLGAEGDQSGGKNQHASSKSGDKGNVPAASSDPHNLNDNGDSSVKENHYAGSSDPLNLTDNGDSSINHDTEDDCLPDEIDALLEAANLEYQLYGKGADTTKLLRGTYCKTSVLTQTLTNSTNINHVLRRLMEGVFIPSKIVNCTVTGKRWNAGGKEHQEQRTPLHAGALQDICEFANAVAKRKKWKGKKEMAQCTSVFSHKLGEIREKVKAGILKD